MASYDATGAHRWSKIYDAASATAIAADGSGNVFAAGGFYGTVDFGGEALTSAGGLDAYVVRLPP